MEAPLENPDIRMQVGLRIKRLRDSAGFTQEDLADRTGIPRGYIADIENGRYATSIVKIKKIADAFGISMKDFFTDEVFER